MGNVPSCISDRDDTAAGCTTRASKKRFQPAASCYVCEHGRILSLTYAEWTDPVLGSRRKLLATIHQPDEADLFDLGVGHRLQVWYAASLRPEQMEHVVPPRAFGPQGETGFTPHSPPGHEDEGSSDEYGEAEGSGGGNEAVRRRMKAEEQRKRPSLIPVASCDLPIAERVTDTTFLDTAGGLPLLAVACTRRAGPPSSPQAGTRADTAGTESQATLRVFLLHTKANALRQVGEVGLPSPVTSLHPAAHAILITHSDGTITMWCWSHNVPAPGDDSKGAPKDPADAAAPEFELTRTHTASHDAPITAGTLADAAAGRALALATAGSDATVRVWLATPADGSLALVTTLNTASSSQRGGVTTVTAMTSSTPHDGAMIPAFRAGRDGHHRSNSNSSNSSSSKKEDEKAGPIPPLADAQDEAGASKGLPPLLFVAGYRQSGGQEVNLIQIWSPRRQSLLLELVGQRARFSALVFGPFHNGPLVSAGADARLVVWDHRRGTKVKTLAGHLGAVNAMAVEPNLGVWSAGDDGAIMGWKVA